MAMMLSYVSFGHPNNNAHDIHNVVSIPTNVADSTSLYTAVFLCGQSAREGVGDEGATEGGGELVVGAWGDSHRGAVLSSDRLTRSCRIQLGEAEEVAINVDVLVSHHHLPITERIAVEMKQELRIAAFEFQQRIRGLVIVA